MVQVISYEKLPTTDLVIDAVYEGVPSRNLSGAALSKLLPGIGNLGGFRAAGHGDDKKFVILYTSGEDKDWPDRLDLNTGQFVYFGDNKSPGHELHDTGRRGNRILRRVFDLLHATPPDRKRIPPFFIFKKYPTPRSSRSVQFKGLAAPGFTGLPATSDLVAVWKTSKGQRFQNYQATFSVLDAPVINRAWLCDLANGISLTTNVPEAWSEWVSKGRYRALTAESTTVIRGRDEQVPDSRIKIEILEKQFGCTSKKLRTHSKHSPLDCSKCTISVSSSTRSRVPPSMAVEMQSASICLVSVTILFTPNFHLKPNVISRRFSVKLRTVSV